VRLLVSQFKKKIIKKNHEETETDSNLLDETETRFEKIHSKMEVVIYDFRIKNNFICSTG
jgi:hypothetical protein